MKTRKSLVAGAALVLLACHAAHSQSSWRSSEHDYYRGDFNGDGSLDLLYIARLRGVASGVAINDGFGSLHPTQSWSEGYLGIDWSSRYSIVLADFNGDRRADIFLQAAGADQSLLLLTSPDGKVVGISQELPAGALGIQWSAEQYQLIAGDYDNSGRDGLFLQSVQRGGMNAVLVPDENGQFIAAPRQVWADGYLGLQWAAEDAVVYSGDFNGDGRDDLLVQQQRSSDSASDAAGSLSGVILAQDANPIFSLAGLRTWDGQLDEFDWSAQRGRLVVADVNDDGRDDVIWEPGDASEQVLLVANARGAVFSRGKLDMLVSYRRRADVFASTDVTPGFTIPSGMGGAGISRPGKQLVTTSEVVAPLAATEQVTMVGRSVGSFGVSDLGAATYSIPLAVPPGIAGLVPSLGIAYQSNGGNGLLGVGWAIAGLSEIHRCNKTLVQDGVNEGITLTTADRYCLNGNKLRLTGGSYGAAGSTYQTELETFARVTAYGSAGGGGPAYFVVEGKDGLIYEYGNSENSRIEAVNSALPAVPHTWALNRVSDRHGNFISVGYIEDGAPNGSYRLGSIGYAGNSIRFGYEDRPNTDIPTRYLGGGLIKETRRLYRIETYRGDRIRRYRLTYDISTTTQRSLLGAVQECGLDDDDHDACLAPTRITWQSGVKGWSGTEVSSSSGATAQMEFAHAIDIDGNGRDDLVYPQGGTWWYMLADGSGNFGAPVDTTVSAANTTAYPIDYFGTGRMGLLVSGSANNAHILRWNGSGLVLLNTDIGMNVSSRQYVTDVDGDGLPDFLYAVSNAELTALILRRNIQSVTQGVARFAAAQEVETIASPAPFTEVFLGTPSSRLVDFDGDGKIDLLYGSRSRICNNTFCGWQVLWRAARFYNPRYHTEQSWVCKTTAIDGCSAVPMTGDFNGDGLTDVVAAEGDWPSVTWTVRYGSGNTGGFSAPTALALPADFNTTAAIVDYDSDGRQDLLYAPSSTGVWSVLRSTGSGFEAPVATTIPSSSNNKTVRVFDLDGDGQRDVGYNNGQYRVRKHNGTVPDLAASIRDGFGYGASFRYSPLTDPAVYQADASFGGVFPVLTTSAPLQVVREQFVSAEPVGYTISHTYRGARIHVQGRGFLGFMSRTATDSRNGTRTTWSYRQDYPYIGFVDLLSVAQPSGKLISRTEYSYRDLVTSSTQYNDRHYAYSNGTTQTSYEVNAADSAQDGEPVRRVTTSIEVDTYGNPTTVTEITTNFAGSGAFVTTTVSTPTNDVANWCLGFVTRQTVTKTIPDAPSLSRAVEYIKDAANPQLCRTHQKIEDPDLSAWAVTTTYGYDSFGNVNSEAVTADGIAARTTTMDYGALGLLPLSTTNAEGETVTTTYDYRFGLLSSETDPNGLTTSWRYDSLGRKRIEFHPDGTSLFYTIVGCTGTCTGTRGYSIREDLRDTANVVQRSYQESFDSMNRLVNRRTQLISGAYSYLRTRYDNLDQVVEQYRPSLSQSGTYQHRTVYAYDLLGRPLTEQRQISESDSGTQTTRYIYERSVHKHIDPNGRTSEKLMNPLGQVTRMTDAAGGVTTYSYDAFGNVLKVADPAGNQIVNIYYPVGLKQTGRDPDLGLWQYEYYPTGELKKQINAKDQFATYTYDRVSRIQTREEVEGTTTYSYGSSDTAKNVGKLEWVTAPGPYSQAYTYDSLGRPLDVIANFDGVSLVVSHGYSATTGLLEAITYPISTTAVPDSRFKVKYEYAYGKLKRVRDFNSPSLIYWEQMASNPAGQVTDELYGNGLRSYSTYDAITGLLGSRTTGASSQVQYLSYQWDKAGNVTQRRDWNLDHTEDFEYDDLYRLESSTLNDVTNLSLSYYANGNINTKSDVGTYTYPTQGENSVRPHAVGAAGSNSYGYDANGNMTWRNGSEIGWYSYNLPSLIRQGGDSARFYYGPDRGRYKQVAVTAAGGQLPTDTVTTLYMQGLYERVTRASSSTVEHRHYIFAGDEPIAIRTLRDNGADDTHYLHRDHLGSVDVITNETGAEVQRLSYDAFGKRRHAISWSGTPGSSDWLGIASLTLRGFTFHEHLDNVELVHMNGRVYDPSLGRFISADPLIQAPLMSQSLNRYSYAMNNPLTMIDPSGYSWLSSAWKKVTRWVKDAWDGLRQSFNFIVGAALIVVGAVTYNPAIIQAGLTVMTFPVQVGRNGDGYWIAYGYGYRPANESSTLPGPAGGSSPPPMTAPPGAVSFSPPSLPEWVVNEFAGIGDSLTFGLTRIARDFFEIGSVDTTSREYQIGSWGAVIGGALVTAGGSLYIRAATSGGVLSNVSTRAISAESSAGLRSVGAAQAWTIKARLRAAKLPTSGRIRYVPPRGYEPTMPLPRGPNKGYVDRFGNEWVHGPSRTAGEAFEWDIQLSRTGRHQIGWLSRDGRHVNVSLAGEVTH